jgi:hypothetical protein
MPKEHIDTAKYHPVTGEPLPEEPKRIEASGGAYITRPGSDQIPIDKPEQIPIQTVPIPTKTVEPIKLTYAYVGNCPHCRSTVKTLEMDVGKSHVAVAYCTNCDKQLESQNVKRLEVKENAKRARKETKEGGQEKVRDDNQRKSKKVHIRRTKKNRVETKK